MSWTSPELAAFKIDELGVGVGLPAQVRFEPVRLNSSRSPRH